MKDELKLPEKYPGDKKKPRLSRSGHRTIIGAKKLKLKERIARYKAMCSDPEPKEPILPVPEKQPDPAPEPPRDLSKVKVVIAVGLTGADLVVAGMVVATVFPGAGWVIGGAAAGLGGAIMLMTPSPANAECSPP